MAAKKLKKILNSNIDHKHHTEATLYIYIYIYIYYIYIYNKERVPSRTR